MMHYKVRIGYTDFDFCDKINAMSFAESAKYHATEDVDVTIKFEKGAYEDEDEEEV